jgi:hypothetical protein
MVIHLVLMKVRHFGGNSTTDMLSVELFGTSSIFLHYNGCLATLSRVLRELKLG